MVETTTFGHFTEALYAFLEALEANNRRDWFKPRQSEYETHVEPARAFIREMEPRLADVAPHLDADDSKVGGSLMRIYRDTRFSKDKTPYKTNVGIQFRHIAGKDVHAAGVYVHISLGDNFVGTGMWRPPSEALKRIRAKIDEEPDRWRAILSDERLTRDFAQHGDSLKRPPRGYKADHPMIDELKRKTFIAMCPLTRAQIVDPRLPELLTERIRQTRAYAAFLCEAIGQPF